MTSAGPIIVTGCDDAYAVPLAVTLSSALRHTEPPASVYILDGGISAKSRSRIERVAVSGGARDLHWIGSQITSPLIDGLVAHRWLSPAAFLRMVIPLVLPDRVNRAVYLDSDMLVLADLGQLWDGRDGGAPVWAVDDFAKPDRAAAMPEICRQLCIDTEVAYFNSGMMLIDLAAWRELSVSEQALELGRELAGRIPTGDQHILNAILGKQRATIDDRWNVQLSVIRQRARRVTSSSGDAESWRADLLAGAQTVHFTGRRKPWEGRYHGPFAAEFVATLLDSGWFESRSEAFAWRQTLRAKAARHHLGRYRSWVQRRWRRRA